MVVRFLPTGEFDRTDRDNTLRITLAAHRNKIAFRIFDQNLVDAKTDTMCSSFISLFLRI